jgi:hypothetical protein
MLGALDAGYGTQQIFWNSLVGRSKGTISCMLLFNILSVHNFVILRTTHV